jgi:hypothetical protein
MAMITMRTFLRNQHQISAMDLFVVPIAVRELDPTAHFALQHDPF